MTPEWVGALAAVGTFIVIALTAVAAVIQLRHIRSANQLSGLLHFSAAFETDAIQSANKFVGEHLQSKLRDPAYIAGLMEANPDRREHPELLVADFLEQQGSYIKFGMIDKAQYLDLVGSYVSSTWQQLTDVVAIRRAARNTAAMYENFEYLAALTESRDATKPSYPPGVPRLLTDEQWREIAARYTALTTRR